MKIVVVGVVVERCVVVVSVAMKMFQFQSWSVVSLSRDCRGKKECFLFK